MPSPLARPSGRRVRAWRLLAILLAILLATLLPATAGGQPAQGSETIVGEWDVRLDPPGPATLTLAYFNFSSLDGTGGTVAIVPLMTPQTWVLYGEGEATMSGLLPWSVGRAPSRSAGVSPIVEEIPAGTPATIRSGDRAMIPPGVGVSMTVTGDRSLDFLVVVISVGPPPAPGAPVAGSGAEVPPHAAGSAAPSGQLGDPPPVPVAGPDGLPPSLPSDPPNITPPPLPADLPDTTPPSLPPYEADETGNQPPPPAGVPSNPTPGIQAPDAIAPPPIPEPPQGLDVMGVSALELPRLASGVVNVPSGTASLTLSLVELAPGGAVDLSHAGGPMMAYVQTGSILSEPMSGTIELTTASPPDRSVPPIEPVTTVLAAGEQVLVPYGSSLFLHHPATARLSAQMESARILLVTMTPL